MGVHLDPLSLYFLLQYGQVFILFTVNLSVTTGCWHHLASPGRGHVMNESLTIISSVLEISQSLDGIRLSIAGRKIKIHSVPNNKPKAMVIAIGMINCAWKEVSNIKGNKPPIVVKEVSITALNRKYEARISA
jgi:hypothetical protein